MYLLAVCGSVDARDIFVSPAGRNNGSGNLQDPLKTPHRAAQIAVAGDVIYLRQGVYRPPEKMHPINFARQGTPEAFLRMTAYTGETVVLSGMRELSDPQSWVHHKGKIYSSTAPLSEDVHLIVQDDRVLEPKKSFESLQGPGQWYFDAENRKLYIWSIDGANPAHQCTEISSANAVILFDPPDTHIQVDNLTITGAFYGIRCLPGGENRIFRNLELKHFTEDAIKFHTTGNHHDVVEFCTFSSFGDFGIDTYGSNHQLFRYNRLSRVHSWKSGGAIKSLAGGNNHIIEGNIIYELGGLGDESALELRETNRTLVANNVIAAVGGGAIRLYADNTSLATPVEEPVTYQIRIINNTIYHTTRSAIWLAKETRDVTIRNNIIHQLGADGACIRVDEGAQAEFQSDFNLLFHPSGAPFQWLDEKYSLDRFSRCTGKDIHSISVDPLFRNTGAFDFRLKSGSPAIDAGDASLIQEQDGNREPRLHGRSVDIGAYEYHPARPR